VASNDSSSSWRQVNVHFADPDTAERLAATHLAPHMSAAENTGPIAQWFFTRKDTWRLRYQPSSAALADQATAAVNDALTSMRDQDASMRWINRVHYEPEIYAFGGPRGIEVAHQLFHYDSRHILGYVRRTLPPAPAIRDSRRELTVLLCSALMRAADQDWYEQGDIWARVSQHRPTVSSGGRHRHARQTEAMTRLLTADAFQSDAEESNVQLESVADWPAGFQCAGSALAAVARCGNLTRGLRSVLAHHVLFHWNRLGIPYQIQGQLAATAARAILAE
jgi:thiopeptide-type bacteriocin biosynthesis protein